MRSRQGCLFAAALALSPALLAMPSEQFPEAQQGPPAALGREAQLKQHYLRCDQVSAERMLTFGEAASCSVVGEQLLKETFGGDFDALLAWWRAAKARPRLAEAED